MPINVRDCIKKSGPCFRQTSESSRGALKTFLDTVSRITSVFSKNFEGASSGLDVKENHTIIGVHKLHLQCIHRLLCSHHLVENTLKNKHFDFPCLKEISLITNFI